MILYFFLILIIACSRLYEIKRSKHHLRDAEPQDDVYPIPEKIYSWMVVFHTSWLISCVGEVYYFERAFLPVWGTVMIMIWLLTLFFRIWTLKTMGKNWNVRVVHHRTQELVAHGPYRYLRHPNYLIVILEVFCIPMIHTAYLTACFGTGLNAILIWKRLQTEEPYLASLPGYEEKIGHLPRFIPQPILTFFNLRLRRFH